eukprot:TRINITY_DN30063_c0_g1_i3.p2 TRINITY_DN30063_c0_g1~~TRINITY_DN30063_c0_g1_i3.p2  ORF type:complete len:157 (+),score=50.17 TRINITY_DN30063_c0_g1_i3:75-545(+)
MPLPDGPAPEPKARGSSDRGPDTDPAACCARQLADALLRTEAAAAAEALDPPRLRYVAALTEALEAKARLLVATVRERGLPAGLVSELAELRVRLEDGIRRAEAEEAELNAELQLYADMQGAHRAEHAALERQYSQLGDELAAAEAMLRAQRRLAQ